MARTREQRPTSEALTENPAGASSQSLSESTDLAQDDPRTREDGAA